MLGDGLGAFKLLPALLAAILVGRHGLEPSNGGGDVCRILRLMADVEKPMRGGRAVAFWRWACFSSAGLDLCAGT